MPLLNVIVNKEIPYPIIKNLRERGEAKTAIMQFLPTKFFRIGYGMLFVLFFTFQANYYISIRQTF